jgi:xylan 1,4-beta-xylosidase
MDYWSFSDVFEEQGAVRTPFYGGFGLVAADNIPKATQERIFAAAALFNYRPNVLARSLRRGHSIAVDSDSILATKTLDGHFHADPEIMSLAMQLYERVD